jgi:hypothetical protein
MLLEFLKQTGLGALPSLPANTTPTEQQVMQELTKGIQELFERQGRLQDNGAVVVNLLNAPALSQTHNSDPSHTQPSRR